MNAIKKINVGRRVDDTHILSASLTKDKKLIREVLSVPEIWETVAEGDIDINDLVIDNYGTKWLLIEDDVEVIAIYALEAVNSVCVDIHAHVLPVHRKKYSRETGLAALKWIKDNVPRCKKVVAGAPDIYPNVSRFLLSFGFKHEGVNRKSHFKNGELRDVNNYGLTIEELIETLNND